MLRFFSFLAVLWAKTIAHGLTYSPGLVLEKTISLNYYNTEYIFITNDSDYPVSLSFELIDADVPTEWSVSGCTNMICYTKIPSDGSFGTLQSGTDGYISINLAINETAGDGEIRFAVYNDENPELRDTIAFIYHVSPEAPDLEPRPWAKINFAQNVVTVFLLNETISTTLYIFDVQGNRVANLKLEDISAISLANFPAGIYIAVVRDENGKEMIQKVVKL